MVYLTIDTEPVKGYVIIRDKYSTGRILAEGTAPVEAYQSGQWAFYASFGEVEGYIKPDDAGGKVLSDKIRTYTYIPVSPPSNGDGEPTPPSNLWLKILLAILFSVSTIGIVWKSRKEK